MSLERVIAVARGEAGYAEDPPGSNRVKYWEDYGPGWQGQPWCVCFLWWCFRQAGEAAAFFGGGRTASCGTLLRWYEVRGQTVPAEQVQPGDIVILNFSGTRDTQHCGLAVEPANGAGWFRTVEGNTAPGPEGSQGNGGSVALKVRHLRQCVGVCRPPCGAETPPSDWAGHWAEADIRWCLDRGRLRGYPDGSFRPEQPVTRGELAAVLRRLEEG